jgi:hypothetical protein
MSEWPNLKIDIWWKAVLVLGLIACIGAASFNIDFLERKHLFGFGIGMMLIGIGFWKSWKTFSQIVAGGILSTQGYKHDVVSILLIILGVLLFRLFGYLIVKGLI